VLIEGLEVGPALKRAHRVLGSCRGALFAGFRRWVGCPVALMLLIGVSACTAADPRSATTPTVSHTAATGMAATPRSSGTVPPQASGKKRAVVPRPDHVVVVILENEQRSSIIESTHAPYLNKLAARGANLTRSYGVTHPSQPNYLALFSGSTQGVTSNACPQRFTKADNLGHQLRTAGFSFAGYAESMPEVGFTGCASGRYQRKHNPWVNFANLPAIVNRPFSAFPRDYRKLPTVSFVSPNMCHSMHDCSIRTGDRWMKKHLDRYARWATGHNSWLVVTFDENAGGTVDPIPTIILGDHVRPGRHAQKINHYALLRTIEDAYGLPALGHAAAASPLSRI
jgi:Phosphoesterase family